MARAKVVHSADACTIIFEGNKSKPEPSTGIIKFPGGHVEVSRTSDGSYWAHVVAERASDILDSRVEYNYERYRKTNGAIPPIPYKEDVKKLAIRVAVPRKR